MRLPSCLGIFIAAGSALLATQATAQTRRFDGTWSVEVITERGNCDQAYRYSIVLENGRARYGGSEAFNITGQVQQNGAVSGSISRGQDRANVRGRLSEGFGSGTWTSIGGRTCSGRWNAEKRS